MNFNIALPFYRSSVTRPDSLALALSGAQLSYAQLAQCARDIGGLLTAGGVKRGSLVGVLASRSIEACAGVLGTAWIGATYVPISLKTPEERLLSVLRLAELDAVVVDANGIRLLCQRVVEACPPLILVPNAAAAGRVAAAGGHTVFALDRRSASPAQAEPSVVGPGDIAYVVFTSGTTGVPKGVMVPSRAVHHYIGLMQERYRITPADRVAETADLSFDVSVSNMFTSWNAGASLHIVPESRIIAAAKFIRDNDVSVWLSVPSIIAMSTRTKALRPGSLPSLRYSLFVGEPLPVAAAVAWQAAASNSIVDNLYGPTEATVCCTAQRLTKPPVVTTGRAVLAIGLPLAGTDAAIVDADLNFLPRGERGELALAGAQLAAGYYKADALTAKRFPVINGRRWYLTGDLACQDERGVFHHLGRTDNQVKVLGNRVELEDVEFHLRAVAQTELVAAVPWPVSHGSAEGIVGFIADSAIPLADVETGMRRRLPSYMVPKTIRVVDTLPLNCNGKIDRQALVAELSAS